MAKQENYFILLGISFDPIETDENVINDAIKAKQQEWSKDQNNPFKRNEALENLKLIQDIESVMLNKSAREKQAIQAKEIKKQQLRDLEKDILKYEAKGFVKPAEIERLVKKYKNFGINNVDIKNKIKKTISDTKPEERVNDQKIEIIDKTMVNGIENNFKQLKLKDYTLYKFLGLPQNSSIQKLLQATDVKRKTLGSDANKTGTLNIELDLCGRCTTVFKDEANKQKYDNYISISKYSEINEAIIEAGASNKKDITPEMMENIIDIGVRAYNITVTEAASYIRKYCSITGYTILGGKKIICGHCKTENTGSIKTCSNCGKPLIIECPSCKAKNGNTAISCVKCRFNLSKMNDAVTFITNSNKALFNKNISEAISNLEEAKTCWPNHPDIKPIEIQIENLKKKFNQLLNAITSDIKEKKFYSAELKVNQIKSEGFDIDKSIETKVRETIKNVELKLKKARTSDGEEGFILLNEIMKEIHDCTEANKLVKQYPPQDVTNIKCEINVNQVILSWQTSKSVGDKEYIVVRKKNSYPNNENDGDVIYTGTANKYSDGSAETEQEYFYSIFTKRAGVISKGCILDNTVVLIDSIESLKAIGGDGIVTLSWSLSNTVREVKVWMANNENRPNSVEECERIVCNRLDGMNICNLENGKKHWVYISTCHIINENFYESTPKLISVVPQKPAQPLQNFEVKNSNGKFIASWEKSEWDIILFKTNKKPNYSNGVIYDISELNSEYEKLDVKFNSTIEAEFSIDFIGVCYIIPGVVNATNVVLNSAHHISSVPSVTNIEYDTNSSGAELYVNFDWPKRIDKVVMVYRTDNFPTDPNDPLAKHIECTKKQYDYDAALLINNPINGIYYTNIYTIIDDNESKIYSESAQIIINNEPQKDIFYDFKYKKGLFSKKRTLILTIKCNGTLILPEFILASKFKSVPLTRDDGFVVYSVMEETTIIDSHTFTFELDDLRKGTFMKMFFVKDKNYKRYKLINEGRSEI